jgi:translation initiation factor IF-3
VPVPRRFDRRPPERDTTRINDRIRVPEVRLVGEDGNQIGVMKTPDALAYAQERDLDLVEVAPEARPPVCRVLDYSKYKYELAQKQKQQRKHQQQITIREIKFRPKIAQNDYDTKKHHVERFLKGKDKVKVTIMFRGREVTHPERGVALLNKLAEELGELAIVEQTPLQDGRNMTMMLAPSKAILAGEGETHEAPAETGEKKKPRRQQRDGLGEDHEHDEELHEDDVDDAPESAAAVEDAPEAATEDKAPEPTVEAETPTAEAEAPAAAPSGAAPQAEAPVPATNGKAAKPASNGTAAKPAPKSATEPASTPKAVSTPKPAPTASDPKPVATPEPETAK